MASFYVDGTHSGARGRSLAPAIRTGYLQYVRIEGERRIYLLSRFIGEEWTKALDGSLHR